MLVYLINLRLLQNSSLWTIQMRNSLQRIWSEQVAQVLMLVASVSIHVDVFILFIVEIICLNLFIFLLVLLLVIALSPNKGNIGRKVNSVLRILRHLLYDINLWLLIPQVPIHHSPQVINLFLQI